MENNLAESLDPSVPEEAKVEAEAQPKEASAEQPPEKKVEDVQPEKLVRLEALHEERSKRKELAKTVERIERERAQERAVLNDRLQQLYAMNQPQPQGPDPNDPLAVQQHELAQHRVVLQQLNQKQHYEDQVRQQNEYTNGLVNWAKSQAAEFAQETPDFDGAYKHVASNRANQLKAMGLSPQDVQAAMIRDELWVYEHAHQTGKNPGEVIYEMARQTGYKGKQGEQKMETLQKGVKASATLGPGGAPSGNPTPEQIAAMTDDEFSVFKAGLKKRGKTLSDAL